MLFRIMNLLLWIVNVYAIIALDDIAYFVTSTTVQNNIYIRGRIIPSSRTWMKNLKDTYVIIEDTPEIRFDLRHCNRRETPKHTTFKCPGEPYYILTRKCSSLYYGASGPCCKVDEVISYINHAPHLSHIQYIAHADDDTFFRPHQVNFLLQIKLLKYCSYILHTPLIATSRLTRYRAKYSFKHYCTMDC